MIKDLNNQIIKQNKIIGELRKMLNIWDERGGEEDDTTTTRMSGGNEFDHIS